MKIEYQEGSNFVVLVATEQIKPGDVSVLKAGVAKLCREKKPDPVFLDLTEAIIPDAESIPPILELQLDALEIGGDLFIVSPNPRLGQFRSSDEASRHMISGASLNAIREQILSRLLRDLVEQRAKLLAQEAGLRETHVIKDQLPIENENLKRTQQAMEKYVADALALPQGASAAPAENPIGDLEAKLMVAVSDGAFQTATLLTAQPQKAPT